MHPQIINSVLRQIVSCTMHGLGPSNDPPFWICTLDPILHFFFTLGGSNFPEVKLCYIISSKVSAVKEQDRGGKCLRCKIQGVIPMSKASISLILPWWCLNEEEKYLITFNKKSMYFLSGSVKKWLLTNWVRVQCPWNGQYSSFHLPCLCVTSHPMDRN